MSNDTRRYFKWSSSHAIQYLLKEGTIKPVPTKNIKLRKHLGDGVYELDGLQFEVEFTMSGCLVYSDSPKKVYRTLREAQKCILQDHNERSIVRPILPASIYQTLQTTVFDYYRAIDELKTTRGFGNVGLIFAGPPGVGKSETMRWIGQVVNRYVYQLSLRELTKMLSNGEPFDSNESLIFIDDIDANILRDRKKSPIPNALTSQFLTCLDGLDKCEGRVIIISTNEDIDDIDYALTRPGRFEHTIHFKYPTQDLIEQFCLERNVDMNPSLFTGWSFAKIDLFLARFKVANYLKGMSINAFYEKFISEMGEKDATVSHYTSLNKDDEDDY